LPRRLRKQPNEGPWAEIGRRIRAERIRLDWTQDDLAERAHISRGMISMVENGGRGLTVDNLHTMANALGRPLAFFVAGVGAADQRTADLELMLYAARDLADDERQFLINRFCEDAEWFRRASNTNNHDPDGPARTSTEG
jgi:transcriptional regulator with XRE-family HTH domain